ncbi:MAG: hypothetical protein COU51_00365 [Parcubacteria group bacterium CG10_big_fil_rev_8_21_14_0_10_36_14]|nr:MAG: hypothetical protein COU51_00365 [Parcubacteria group bacterium CG10_big_fil_rev_8_21_14_0_10_36_14]
MVGRSIALIMAVLTFSANVDALALRDVNVMSADVTRIVAGIVLTIRQNRTKRSICLVQRQADVAPVAVADVAPATKVQPFPLAKKSKI